uniref:SH3 domain-binding protein 4-like n=1 Tax=Petromyzon marinus TaxID=7757 RepID=A0AAJ7TDS9_PETMA|nr:SH3 domain-binding protein 4-like [Petromyzon marinus]
MAAQRIRAVQAADMSRSHSEGDLIDFDADDEFSSKRLSDSIPANASSPFAKSSVCEVVAVRDFSPGAFPALSMQRGDRLSVLDTAGPEWWYARNRRCAGFIPASHVRPVDGAAPLRRALADSGMVDSGEGDSVESETEGSSGEGRPRAEAPGRAEGAVAPTEVSPAERPTLATGDAGDRHSCASTGDLLLERKMGNNPFLQSAYISNPFLSDIMTPSPSDGFHKAENTSAEKLLFDFDSKMVLRNGVVSADSEPQNNIASSGIYSSNDVFAVDNSDALVCMDLNMEKLLSRQMRSGNGQKPSRHDSGRNNKQRSHSLSELSAMQATQAGQDMMDFLDPLGKPLSQDYGSLHDREAYRTAWLQQRQMTRSCHNLGALCRNPGWGQTQPLQTQAVFRLESSGGSVQVPETSVKLHAAPLPATSRLDDDDGAGVTREVRLRALLDPPIKLSGDMMTAVSPVVEVRLVGHPVLNPLMLEMRVAAHVKEDPLSQKCAEIVCLGAENPEGPYALLPESYVHGDIIRVQLDNKSHCVYVVAVAQLKCNGSSLPWDAPQDAESIKEALVSQPRAVSETSSTEQQVVSQMAQNASGSQSSHAGKTIWDFIQRQMTLAVYGPKHLHPTFTLVLALFGHFEAPSTLPSTDTNWEGKVGKKSHQQPIGLTLWGKHEFTLNRPQNVDVSLFSSEQNVQVTGSKSGSAKSCCTVRGFQLRLGRVCRMAFQLSYHDSSVGLAAFALRAQLHTDAQELLTQFSVTTPPATAPGKVPAPRRFVKRKELGRSLLSSISSAPPSFTVLAPRSAEPATFQEHDFVMPMCATALKTIVRQTKFMYFLEYRKGATIGLLSKEKIRARGHAKTKEWYVGYTNGCVGLVHCKNLKLLPDNEQVAPSEAPHVNTATLLELLLRPCHSLNFSWSTVSTKVAEGLADWRPLARVLGYREEEMEESFVEEDVDRVSAVLEKLKGDCAGGDGKRRCFLKELFSALLRLDQHAVVVRVLLDCVLLTVSVDLGARWRELAAHLANVTRQQAEAYEAPHCQDGVLLPETVWKPAFDFLVTWSGSSREGYWDTLQEMHTALDRTRGSGAARGDRALTGVLLLAHGLDTLRAHAFPVADG